MKCDLRYSKDGSVLQHDQMHNDRQSSCSAVRYRLSSVRCCEPAPGFVSIYRCRSAPQHDAMWGLIRSNATRPALCLARHSCHSERVHAVQRHSKCLHTRALDHNLAVAVRVRAKVAGGVRLVPLPFSSSRVQIGPDGAACDQNLQARCSHTHGRRLKGGGF